MSGEGEWDVEQYKTEHECDEHWELRRKFLVTHRDKFSEDELVCLAQVFTNIEFLGCRYPKETMQLVAELAQDIVRDYRERQKNKLQRTFVKATEAASSKVKGMNAPIFTTTIKTGTQLHITGSKASRSFSVPIKRKKLSNCPFGDIVIVQRPGDVPQNILGSAINAAGGRLECKFDKVEDSWNCSLYINSILLAEACNSNQKLAKKEASAIGLSELQKHYYTIKIKHTINDDTSVTATAMMKDIPKNNLISDDNIGKKLMKLMGWTGDGLGKLQQGIVEPITIKQQISREGLGFKSNSWNINDLKRKSEDIMKQYLSSDMKSDLIFSADFTNEERAAIHQVARKLSLKSHSYGSKKQRTLVVSRKIDVRDLVEELKGLGGTTSKYQLIEPSGI